MNTVKQLLKHKNFMFKLGLAICIGWILIAILAPLLVPYHPITHQNMAGRFQPPAPSTGLEPTALAGMCLAGCCTAAVFPSPPGWLPVLISFLVGILFGGISGYVGGVVDDVMMRFSEMVQSFRP